MISRQERETIMTRSDESDRSTTLRIAKDQEAWHIFSEIPADIRMFEKLFGPGEHTRELAVEWEVPRVDLKIHRKKKMKEMSAAEKKRRRDLVLACRPASE